MRLTNRKTCSDLKNNAERLKAKGMEVSISDLMYIKLAEYENAEEDADVQPVVRCKDCKHRKERHYEEIGEKPYIKYECKFTKYSMSDDGFCSFGARIDGDVDVEASIEAQKSREQWRDNVKAIQERNLLETKGKVLAVGLGGSFKDSLIKTEVDGLFLNFEQDGDTNE